MTYIRRIIKQPNPEDISNDTIVDYINRFYAFDVPARIQLFDLKTRYQLELQPNIDRYNAPITVLPNQTFVPTYNSFLTPAYIDGYQVIMQQSNQQWNNLWNNRYNNAFQQSGDGTAGPFTFNIANSPVIRGHRDQNLRPSQTVTAAITGATQALQCVLTINNSFTIGDLVTISGISLGSMVELNGNTYTVVNATPTTVTLGVDSTLFAAYVVGSGGTASLFIPEQGILSSSVFITAQDVLGDDLVLQDDGLGNLIGGGTGTVNYLTGAISATFANPIPATSQIRSQSIPYSAGRPQSVLFYDNIFTFRPVPADPVLFEIDAYYNPASFLATNDSVPYRWMTEYIARGTARKILTDYGDTEQLAFYEPYFREQENFVLRRTTRQNSNVRVSTIFQGQTTLNSGSYNTR